MDVTQLRYNPVDHADNKDMHNGHHAISITHAHANLITGCARPTRRLTVAAIGRHPQAVVAAAAAQRRLRRSHNRSPFTDAAHPCRFNIATRWIHDITVASGASVNVFSAGRGLDVNLDHHRAAPFTNLVTDLNLGYGTRPFSSGGDAGQAAHSGG